MDTLRATGQIHHAKNLHSARSTSKAKRNGVSVSQWAQWEGGMNSRCTFVSRSDRNWRGVFKMRDLADLGQSSSSVNTTVLPQSSKTEENHNTERRNAEKVKMDGKDAHQTRRRLWRRFFLSSAARERESATEKKWEMEDMEIDSWCVTFFSKRQQPFMLCW